MTTPYLPSRWLISAADVSDDPDIFPFLIGQSFLQLKTPMWSTKVDTAVSGVERRRALWSYPIWKFKVGYDMLRDAPATPEVQKLWTFFNAHAGQFQAFLYYDRTDNAVSGQSIGTGDGSTTTFQLVRTMTYGGITFTEPVRAVSGTPMVTVAGTPTTAFTIGALGQITFTSAPAGGAAIAWSGNFFFLCRFGQDELDTSALMSGLWNGNGLAFQTVKS